MKWLLVLALILIAFPAMAQTRLDRPQSQVNLVCGPSYGAGPHLACALRTDGGACVIYIVETLPESRKVELFNSWRGRCP